MENSVIKGCKFHHVSINVTDYDRSVKFYESLGMHVYLEFDLQDGQQHGFIDVGDGPYLEIHSTNEPKLIESRMQHFCFHVDDVDAAYAAAIANGGREKGFPPRDCPLPSTPKPIPNARVAHFFGPDGESIELINWGGFKLE